MVNIIPYYANSETDDILGEREKDRERGLGIARESGERESKRQRGVREK